MLVTSLSLLFFSVNMLDDSSVRFYYAAFGCFVLPNYNSFGRQTTFK